MRLRAKGPKVRLKKRSGVPVSRGSVFTVPVQDMKLLWSDAVTQDANQQKVLIQIIAEGIDRNLVEWAYGVELYYSSPELAYCRPMESDKEVPEDAYNVYHLPPLSGVQTLEKKVELGAQRHVIGEGRPGEILRNLLWQVQEKGKLEELNKQLREMFHLQLEPISFNPKIDAHIQVYYKPEGPKTRMGLEISNGGSGFLQFLLLAAFLYTHESSMLLIDEPDSHMHVRLQQSMYDWLQKVSAENNIQLLISTHSEVIINSTDVDSIYTFFGREPKQIDGAKSKIVSALKSVRALDIISAQDKKFVLFVEGVTDLRILKRWACVLGHPVCSKLNDVYCEVTGNDLIDYARNKFQSLQIVEPGLKGLFIRDGAVARTSQTFPGLKIEYWARNEIENYLIVPSVLEKFVSGQNVGGELFVQIYVEKARQYLKDNLAPNVYNNPLQSDIGGKGSDFLEGFFAEVGIRIGKGDYWRIADTMLPSEINADVTQLLDMLDQEIP